VKDIDDEDEIEENFEDEQYSDEYDMQPVRENPPKPEVEEEKRKVII